MSCCWHLVQDGSWRGVGQVSLEHVQAELSVQGQVLCLSFSRCLGLQHRRARPCTAPTSQDQGQPSKGVPLASWESSRQVSVSGWGL